MAKKLLAVFMAVLMLAGAFAVGVSAVGVENINNIVFPTFTEDGVPPGAISRTLGIPSVPLGNGFFYRARATLEGENANSFELASSYWALFGSEVDVGTSAAVTVWVRPRTGLAAGTHIATVRVQRREHTEVFEVRVTVLPVPVPVTGVTIVGAATRNLTVGQMQQMNATVTPSNATNQSVTWQSSNINVATVSANGLVTARAAGSAIITVRTADGNHTAQVTVNVTEQGGGSSSNLTWLWIVLGIVAAALVAVAAVWFFLL